MDRPVNGPTPQGHTYSKLGQNKLKRKCCKMSWFLMNEKGKREKKLRDLKKHFERADKDGDEEISKQDWFDALTVAKIPVTMYVHN